LIKLSSLPEAGEELVVEDGRLTVHLLDSDLGVADHDITLGQQPPGHLLLGVHNVSELDLLLPELLLVLLQPGLVILDEQMNGVSLGQKGRSKGGVLHISGDGAYHQLLLGGPPGVGGGTPRLEPVLALAMLVGQRHDGGVLHVVKAGFHRIESLLGGRVGTGLASLVKGGQGDRGRGPGQVETAAVIKDGGADLRGGEVDGLGGLHDGGWLLGDLGPGHWLFRTAGLLHLVDHLVGDLKERDPVGHVGNVPHHSALLGREDSFVLLGPQTQILLLCLVCGILETCVQIGLVGQRTSSEKGQPNRHSAAIFILVREVKVLLKDVILEG